MTLRHLKIFAAVYSEMSITKAAQKLHLTQPGVSQAVRELEDYYHIRLFDRMNRRISATEKGTQLYAYARELTGLFEEMEASVMFPDTPGSLHIGSSITIGNTLLPGVLQKLQSGYPDCDITVTVRNSRQIIQSVLRAELDIGLVENHVGHEMLAEFPFCQDVFRFVCRAQHPLAGKEKPDLQEICRYPFFMREEGSASRDAMDDLARIHQVKYRVTFESISNQAIICALNSLDGISVLPERIVENEINNGSFTVLPLYPEMFSRQFSLVYHKRKYMSAALKSMIELLMKPDI